MNEVNSELTKSQHNVSNNIIPDVDIRDLSCEKSFKIENMTDKSVIGSIQGYDIDENAENIYISSGYSPTSSEYKNDKSRKVVKIPWGSNNKADWDIASVPQIEEQGYETEPEGIQYIGNNDVYLTVAYHDPSQEGDLTVMNRIYHVTW